jgi:hypothetical protein
MFGTGVPSVDTKIVTGTVKMTNHVIPDVRRPFSKYFSLQHLAVGERWLSDC